MTRKQLAESLREHLADAMERGRVLAQALRVRADMAVVRRRLQRHFADLGREAYQRLSAGQLAEMAADARAADLRQSIDGLRAELRLKEEELRQVLQCGCCGKGHQDEEAGPGSA